MVRRQMSSSLGLAGVRGARRLRLLMSLAVCSMAVGSTLVVADGASAATLSWSKAQALTSESGVKMSSIACPASTQCTAVWAIEGEVHHETQGEILEVTFNPLSLSSAHAAGISVIKGAGAEEIKVDGVSCPSLTQCTAIDHNAEEITFEPQNGTVVTDSVIDNHDGREMHGISCVSEAECVLVDLDGQESFDPQKPVLGGSYKFSGGFWTALTCVPAETCVAVGGAEIRGGEELTFPPSTDTGSVDALSSAGLTGVSCPSAEQCTAVGNEKTTGDALTFNPAQPGSPEPAAIDTGGAGLLEAIACPSSTQCTAVDALGRQVTFNPHTPGTPEPSRIAGLGLVGVACPSEEECVAIDEAGQAFIGTAGSQTSGTGGNTGGNTAAGSGSNTSSSGSSSTPSSGSTVTEHDTPRAKQVKVANSDELSVALECVGPQGQGCQVIVHVEVTETIEGHKVKAVIAKRRVRHVKVIVGTLSASIAVGTSRTLVLKLNAAGQKLLEQRHSLPVHVVVSQSSSGGAPAASVTANNVTLKQPHKR